MNGNELLEIETTAEVPIPKDPLARVIGQDHAVRIARIAARQRRHLLLVGPPGTGKSMIAQALSFHLPPPTEEIQIVHNPENPERPFVEMKKEEEVRAQRELLIKSSGVLVTPQEVPLKIASDLGFFCQSCETYSPANEKVCPNCGASKVHVKTSADNPFKDLLGLVEITINQLSGGKERVRTTRMKPDGEEEVVVYEREGEMIRVLDEEALAKRRALSESKPRKILVPLERRTFIMAIGASETELLGDVRHDPYGGHPNLGTLPYERVIPGAIHEAHQGVLFLDELPHLGHLQRHILTAMQDKYFPISGRNPQSSGAAVRVDAVPCDFILVGACNIQDLPIILSPLRNRISGSGYEIVLSTTMPDTEVNRARLVQFVAQEIYLDGRIPHASIDGVEEVINEAKRRALEIDGKNRALTLRLRDLGGLVRVAGDLAVSDESEFIEPKHVREAMKVCRSAESQLSDKFGSYFAGFRSELTDAQRMQQPYNLWNQEINPPGYE